MPDPYPKASLEGVILERASRPDPFSRVNAAALRLWQRFRRARSSRATRAAFRILDDRTLKDIGLSRSDAEAISAGLISLDPRYGLGGGARRRPP